MGTKKKIFVVDDDETILSSLQRLLELSGFEAKTCQKPQDAFGFIKTYKPDVILLDLLMPTMGGFEVCELLNKDRETQNIPIIIISALVDDKDIKRAYHLGVVSYFSKPYDFQKLLHEINKTIAFKEGRSI